MKAPTLAYSELTDTIYICYGREKVDVTEQAIKMVKAIYNHNQINRIQENSFFGLTEKAGDNQ